MLNRIFADWISRKLASLPGCLQLKAFNLTQKGNKFSVWSDGSIKGLEVFLFTSKVSRELGTYMTRLVKKVKTYIDNRYTVLRHVDSPSMSLRQYASFHASKRSAGHFRVLANSSTFSRPGREISPLPPRVPTNNLKNFLYFTSKCLVGITFLSAIQAGSQWIDTSWTVFTGVDFNDRRPAW